MDTKLVSEKIGNRWQSTKKYQYLSLFFENFMTESSLIDHLTLPSCLPMAYRVPSIVFANIKSCLRSIFYWWSANRIKRNMSEEKKVGLILTVMALLALVEALIPCETTKGMRQQSASRQKKSARECRSSACIV